MSSGVVSGPGKVKLKYVLFIWGPRKHRRVIKHVLKLMRKWIKEIKLTPQSQIKESVYRYNDLVINIQIVLAIPEINRLGISGDVYYGKHKFAFGLVIKPKEDFN